MEEYNEKNKFKKLDEAKRLIMDYVKEIIDKAYIQEPETKGQLELLLKLLKECV